MNFLVILKQRVGGCDYTIGCGVRYYMLEADNIEDACEKVVYPDGRNEHSIARKGEFQICQAYIIPEHNLYEIDLDSFRVEEEERLAKESQEKRDKQEYFLYKQLKEKFGDKDVPTEN